MPLLLFVLVSAVTLTFVWFAPSPARAVARMRNGAIAYALAATLLVVAPGCALTSEAREVATEVHRELVADLAEERRKAAAMQTELDELRADVAAGAVTADEVDARIAALKIDLAGSDAAIDSRLASMTEILDKTTAGLFEMGQSMEQAKQHGNDAGDSIANGSLWAAVASIIMGGGALAKSLRDARAVAAVKGDLSTVDEKAERMRNEAREEARKEIEREREERQREMRELMSRVAPRESGTTPFPVTDPGRTFTTAGGSGHPDSWMN